MFAAAGFPQQRLYFSPEWHGQGALRGVLGREICVAGAGLQNEPG